MNLWDEVNLFFAVCSPIFTKKVIELICNFIGIRV